MSKKIYLGGTDNGSTWRDDLLKRIDGGKFSVAEQGTPHDKCDFLVYVVTPKMNGVYSIAELVDDTNKRKEKTFYCIVEKDGDNAYTSHQIKALKKVGEMVKRNGGTWFQTFDEMVTYLNANA